MMLFQQPLLSFLLFITTFPAATVIGHGINIQPSYFNNGTVTIGYGLMKKYPQITSVRIEIEPDMVHQAYGWINEASLQGYSIIATYHKYKALGSDSSDELMLAAKWWQEYYKYLSEAGNFHINLMNEWGSHDQTATSYSQAYNPAIATIRSVYTGPLVIDIPGWGQETHVASLASSLLLDKQLIFSTHIYPQAFNKALGRYVNSADMQELFQTGRPCIVGEFGDVATSSIGTVTATSSTQQCDVKTVVETAKNVGFQTVYGWAWNGDGGALNMVSPAWTDDATAEHYSETEYFWPILNLLS